LIVKIQQKQSLSKNIFGFFIFLEEKKKKKKKRKENREIENVF
jgi:hypothetical protein